MSNERTDDFLSWRGRLDQPDALPEQGLDNHEASWQRLAERLREKPRRLTGYWVAAACLLLALIPAVRFLHPRSPATALRTPAPVALHPLVRQQALAEKVVARSLPVVYSVTPPPVVKHHRPPASRQAPDSIISPTAPVAITAPDLKPVTDSHQLTALVPASKKQLKVVYYNEISNPAGPSPSMAGRVPGFLKFSMGRSGTPVAGGEPVEQPYNDPVLTIRLIPQNN
jgi:hypothetical protein